MESQKLVRNQTEKLQSILDRKGLALGEIIFNNNRELSMQIFNSAGSFLRSLLKTVTTVSRMRTYPKLIWRS